MEAVQIVLQVVLSGLVGMLSLTLKSISRLLADIDQRLRTVEQKIEVHSYILKKCNGRN